ncbi:hypothetical protein M501DRAFT_822009 [Patellaria atrata CBS 101060]|uniref:Transmembrane protein n=1 Tax=Patellaria atrata CBS 101060 TaxID=1346257 RepID=A0A9P4VSJ6_9PEZI|nr:hypothetical protein M501DRAFT_822009 [Patellaria atrata CBS 101060]
MDSNRIKYVCPRDVQSSISSLLLLSSLHSVNTLLVHKNNIINKMPQILFEILTPLFSTGLPTLCHLLFFPGLTSLQFSSPSLSPYHPPPHNFSPGTLLRLFFLSIYLSPILLTPSLAHLCLSLLTFSPLHFFSPFHLYRNLRQLILKSAMEAIIICAIAGAGGWLCGTWTETSIERRNLRWFECTGKMVLEWVLSFRVRALVKLVAVGLSLRYVCECNRRASNM